MGSSIMWRNICENIHVCVCMFLSILYCIHGRSQENVSEGFYDFGGGDSFVDGRKNEGFLVFHI